MVSATYRHLNISIHSLRDWLERINVAEWPESRQQWGQERALQSFSCPCSAWAASTDYAVRKMQQLLGAQQRRAAA